MPENRFFRRGRRRLTYAEAANRAADLLGEDPPYPPRRTWFIRLLLFLLRLLTFGRWPKRPAPRPPNPDFLWWGGVHMRPEDAIGHFLICGGTGVGKSLILQRLFKSALRPFGPGKDHRAFIFDAKRELHPKLAAMRPDVPIILVDPFDERGWAWDLAADITSPADALQLAESLIPASKNETDRFWTTTGRNIVAAVIQTFIATAPGRWTLRDLLLVMRSRERIATVLASNPDIAHLWTEASHDERTVSNLMASFNAQLSRYNTVAALWQRCPRKFSLKEWVTSDSVLLVHSHPKFGAVLQPFHQAMIDLLADYLLSQSESRTRRTWIFLDECRDLGRIAKLPRLANLSRSVGGVLALGIQSVEGMYEAYGGEHAAAELMGQMRNVTFLRTNSQTTAAFAERYFGSAEWLVERISYNRSRGSKGEITRGRSIDHSHRTDPVFLASELMDIVPPSLDQPLQLFNDIPAIGCFHTSVPLQSFLDAQPNTGASTPNFVEVATRSQRLADWKAADLKRLKLPERLLLTSHGTLDPALAQLDVLAQLETPQDPKKT
jgi:hypothetical protein